jgi:phosphoribosylaminoimidazole carboxylase, PurE protein
MSKKIAIIMGSSSDLPTMRLAEKVLQDFNVEYDIEIISAHRTPERMFEFAKNARNNNYAVIIAGAGGAAHLPGMVAALTTLPVIGVPIESKALKGMDSLLSIVQMPKGVPVATVAIGESGAQNAGLLAVQILATHNQNLAQLLKNFRQEQQEKVLQMNREDL